MKTAVLMAGVPSAASLAEAMRLTHAKQHRIRGGKEPTWIGLSWINSDIEGREIHWHNGQTGGRCKPSFSSKLSNRYRSFRLDMST
jgi:hypothetical protein